MRRKKAAGLLAASLLLILTGCASAGIRVNLSQNDQELASVDSQSLSIKECSLILMQYQNQYNAYYSQLQAGDFWNQEIEGESFSEYLRDHRLLEEIASLLYLNAMAEEAGLELSEETKEACQQAAAVYYQSLSEQEKAFCKTSEKTVASLYEKYAAASQMIVDLTEDSNLEISENDKRVISLELLAVREREDAEEARARVEAGEEFAAVAREVSELEQMAYDVSRGSLNPVLEEVAFYMEDGELSEIIPTDESYYLIYCVEDYDEQLTQSNEESVYAKRLYELWEPQLLEYAKQHPLKLDESVWKQYRFSAADELTNVSLYTIYEEYVGLPVDSDF